jgi:hypothetical protein
MGGTARAAVAAVPAGAASVLAAAVGGLEQWAQWRRDAVRHTPARSGRSQVHADSRARGDCGGNKGIGSGRALGTELAQVDFRRNTTRCVVRGCDALCDAHWLRRGEEEEHGLCAACRGARGVSRARQLVSQVRMAEAVESGERRLVEFRGLDADGRHIVWVLPDDAARMAASAARTRARIEEANPPARGRPRKNRRVA